MATRKEEVVQGIGSSLDDLKLRGESWRAKVGDVLTGGTLERTIAGASTVAIDIRDAKRKLLNSPLLRSSFEITLDDLDFTYVKMGQPSLLSSMTLTLEDSEVHRLRLFKGPKKAFRDKVTRAEFVNQLRLEAAKHWRPIPFFCPELHKLQPIASDRQARRTQTQESSDRRSGIDPHAKLRVWAVGGSIDATAAHKEVGDTVLRTCASHDAPYRVQVAAIATVMVEHTMSAQNSFQLLGSTAASTGLNPNDVAACCAYFLTKGFTDGVGAIPFYKQNPGASPGTIAQHCQGSALGNTRYDQAAHDARGWVDAFHGGADAGGGSFTETIPERFAFEVKKDETYWAAIQRLAGEVHWRAFMVAGKLYFVTDSYLLRSKRRLVIDHTTPGVEDIGPIDYDVGKPVTEVQLSARAHTWQAPPGTVVELEKCGPASGRMIVTGISAPLRHGDSLCTITLQTPTKPLPEPAPQTRTRTIDGGNSGAGSSAPGNVGRSIDKMIAEIDRIDAKHYPYSTPGARGTPPPAHGPYDCSGFVSRILFVGGLLDTTEATPALSTMYQPGLGDWLSLYVRGSAGSAGHVVGRIKTPSGWRFFATSTSNPGGGAGWVSDSEYSSSYLATLPSHRHPKGF